jgi:hypothetical protein
MSTSPLVAPLLAMMLLTFVVWVVMYAVRLTWMMRNGIAAQAVNTPARMTAAMPERVHYPSDNLKNLFELPVIFYALALLHISGQLGPAQAIDVNLAWGFVGFRALHSAVHCSINIVLVRFTAYILASAALWTWLVLSFVRAMGGMAE